MRLLRMTFMVLWGCLLTSACGSRDRSPEGIYDMQDLRKMKEFVGYPGIPGYAYCMEFRPNKSLARIKFLESPQVYELRIEKIGESDFILKGKNGTRKAKVKAEVSNPGNHWYVLIYFEDSSPYSEEAKHKNIPYDGGKNPSFKTLDECVQAQITHLKEAEEQSYPTPEQVEQDNKKLTKQEKLQ